MMLKAATKSFGDKHFFARSQQCIVCPRLQHHKVLSAKYYAKNTNDLINAVCVSNCNSPSDECINAKIPA